MAFIEKQLRALRPRSNAYRVYERGSDPGFCARVTPAGTVIFQLAYRWDGRQRYIGLGTYGRTTLAQARADAREALALLDRGISPRAERERIEREHRTAENERTRRGSVRQLIDHYLSELEARGSDTREPGRCLRRDALPKLRPDRPAKEVTADDVRMVLYHVHKRGKRVMANRLRSYLRAAFQAGLHHDHDPRNMGAAVLFGLETNPGDAVPRDQGAQRVGERNLTFAEIRTVWQAMAEHFPPMQQLALRLLIASGQRVWEVTEAESAEFDLENRLWTIPPHRIKTGRVRPVPHLVPVTELMGEQVERARYIMGGSSRYLFPAYNRPDATRPMGQTTLAHACRTLCAHSGVEVFTPRDLRRTWKTRAGEVGIPKEWRDRVQNHALGDVSTRHYDRYDHIAEKRDALERWASALQSALTADSNSPAFALPVRGKRFEPPRSPFQSRDEPEWAMLRARSGGWCLGLVDGFE